MMVRLTITYGLSGSSPSAFATFGFVVSGALKDLATGSRCSEMALSMLEKLSVKVSPARAMFRAWGFCLSYTRPLHDASKALMDGYKLGMQSGDTESAAYCLLGDLSASFVQGKKLESLEEDCIVFMGHMRELGRTKIVELSSSILESVQYLLGRTDTCDLLLEEIIRDPQPHELPRLVYSIAMFAYLGDYEKGATYAIQYGDMYLSKSPGAITAQGEVFSRGVCLYAMARKSKKSIYKKYGRRVRATIQRWVDQGYVNGNHHLRLLIAEDLALDRRQLDAASKAYQEAISIAARSGYLKDVGLINERYADFLLLTMEDREQAAFRLKESIRYYSDWGSVCKVERLRNQFAELLPVPAAIVDTTEGGAISRDFSSAFSIS